MDIFHKITICRPNPKVKTASPINPIAQPLISVMLAYLLLLRKLRLLHASTKALIRELKTTESIILVMSAAIFMTVAGSFAGFHALEFLVSLFEGLMECNSERAMKSEERMA